MSVKSVSDPSYMGVPSVAEVGGVCSFLTMRVLTKSASVGLDQVNCTWVVLGVTVRLVMGPGGVVSVYTPPDPPPPDGGGVGGCCVWARVVMVRRLETGEVFATSSAEVSAMV